MADSITFRFSGGEQYSLDLHRWRDRLRGEVATAAVAAATRIVALASLRYHAGPTGNLRKHIKVVTLPVPGSDVVLVTIRNSARHAHLYEFGTKVRWTTGRRRMSAETARTAEVRQALGLPMRTRLGGSGKKAHRGIMPDIPTFVPIAISQRAGFMQEVRRILEKPEPSLGVGTPTVTRTGA